MTDKKKIHDFPPRGRTSDDKTAIGTRMGTDIVERIKNYVYWTPGASISAVLEIALKRELERIEEANDGPYPQRKQYEMKLGRPIK